MENLPVEPNPAPESPPLPETVAEPPAPVEADELLRLTQAAKAARLSRSDEERATTLLKERLSGGKAGITAAVGPMVEGLPWTVSADAVSAVWEKLSVPMRRHLLGSIAKVESDPARRLRLSLARAIFKLEPAAGLKLAAAAAADLPDPETGALSAKAQQFFSNIFIGKGKPWLLQLALADLKPGEADALVHCAIACFPLCPPISQLSILRWTDGAGRLKKLKPADMEAAAKSVARWNAKLQRQLKSEIPELPAPLEGVLKPEALQPAPAQTSAESGQAKRPESKKSSRVSAAAEPPPGSTEEGQAEPESAEPAVPVEELVIPGRAERLAKKAAEKQANRHPEPERRKPERTEERPERPERARAFDLKEALRGVENYVASLRSELEQANRQKAEGGKRGRSARTVEEMPSAEVEALTRHNARLETTVAELRAQLEDLAAHHETVAESRQLHTDAPLPEGDQQLRALLAIKLQESYETYEAMRLEPLDKVFRLDYRDLLGSVFETLAAAGVGLKKEAK